MGKCTYFFNWICSSSIICQTKTKTKLKKIQTHKKWERERDLFGVGKDGSFTSEAIGSNLGSERRIRSHFSVFCFLCFWKQKKNGVGFDLSLSLSMYHSMYVSPIYSFNSIVFYLCIYIYIYILGKTWA